MGIRKFLTRTIKRLFWALWTWQVFKDKYFSHEHFYRLFGDSPTNSVWFLLPWCSIPDPCLIPRIQAPLSYGWRWVHCFPDVDSTLLSQATLAFSYVSQTSMNFRNQTSSSLHGFPDISLIGFICCLCIPLQELTFFTLLKYVFE